MAAPPKRLRVFVTLDVDQDGASAIVPERSSESWAGLRFLSTIHRTLSDLGIRYTAFVRADDQIRDQFGSFLGLLRQEQRYVDTLLSDGGVTGWHPHLYSRSHEPPHPIHDPEEACRALDGAFQEVQREPAMCSLVRLGEAWHSTATMRRLSEMGFRLDSTAIPGRARDDAQLRFDWSPTPNRPYHPAASDYRREGAEDALAILEVPITSMPIRTSYDAQPLRRYLNLCYQPPLFSGGLDAYLTEIADRPDAVLVPIVHPHELLSQPENGLYCYGVATFHQNLATLMTKTGEIGRHTTFEPLSALVR